MIPLLLLGEAYGESEARLHTPFVGASGVALIRMLIEAGIIPPSPIDNQLLSAYYRTTDPAHIAQIWRNHPSIVRTNVFNLHPPSNDLAAFLGTKADGIPGLPPLKLGKTRLKPAGNYVRAEFQPELERLADELITYNPNIVVCLGNSALWALTGQTGVAKLRGTTLLSTHLVSDLKLLPTYHPAAVLRAYDLRPTVIADLIKAHSESKFPEIRRPARDIWIEPSLADIRSFIDFHIHPGGLLSVDIETSGDRITCIGFAPRPDLALVIPFDDSRTKNGCYWLTPADECSAWDLVRSVLESPRIPKLFQNGAYDVAFLYRSMGIRVLGCEEDTMLLHHALQPEALKGLGYLGSVYSDEGTWKNMRKEHTTKRDD